MHFWLLLSSISFWRCQVGCSKTLEVTNHFIELVSFLTVAWELSSPSHSPVFPNALHLQTTPRILKLYCFYWVFLSYPVHLWSTEYNGKRKMLWIPEWLQQHKCCKSLSGGSGPCGGRCPQEQSVPGRYGAVPRVTAAAHKERQTDGHATRPCCRSPKANGPRQGATLHVRDKRHGLECHEEWP